MRRPHRVVRAFALVGVLLTALTVAAPDPAAAAPTGDGPVTLVLRDVVLAGVAISSGPGRSPRTVRLTIKTLPRIGNLRLDVADPDGALTVTAGGSRAVSAPAGVVLDASFACVRGLGVTRAGFLRGILDGPLNEALAVDQGAGFQPNFAIGLANLIGATPVEIVVDELQARTTALTAARLDLPAARVVRTGAEAPPLRGCSAAPPSGSDVDTPQGRGDVMGQLRQMPGLGGLPDPPGTVPRERGARQPASGADVGEERPDRPRDLSSSGSDPEQVRGGVQLDQASPGEG